MNPTPLPNSAPDDLPRPGIDAELEAIAAILRTRAGDAGANELAERVEQAGLRLAGETDSLKRRLLSSLSVNHDINNALVGVVGNAQLLGLGPAAALPGVKERLEVIARESNRIKQATLKLSELKQAILVEGRGNGRGVTS
jgi:signal transduction histidine kinase